MKTSLRTAFGVPALLLALSGLASAATITVTGTGDTIAVDGATTVPPSATPTLIGGGGGPPDRFRFRHSRNGCSRCSPSPWRESGSS